MKILVYDIGGSAVKWATLDNKLNILMRGSFKTFFSTYKENPNRVKEELYGQIIQHINDMKEKESIYMVGISSACVINTNSGLVIGENRVFRGYKGLNIYQIIKEGTGLDCLAMNDGNSGVLGEHVKGSLKNIDSAVMLVIGTGIGAGILHKGEIYGGHNYWAGEIGFIWVEDGYWEDKASTVNMIRAVSNKLGKNVSGHYVFSHLDNPIIKEQYDIWIRRIAIGVKAVFHVLGPEVILIGGGISIQEKFKIEDIKEAIKPMVAPEVFEEIKLKKASLGNDANIYGVASKLVW